MLSILVKLSLRIRIPNILAERQLLLRSALVSIFHVEGDDDGIQVTKLRVALNPGGGDITVHDDIGFIGELVESTADRESTVLGLGVGRQE
jgi:hypothetical protein